MDKAFLVLLIVSSAVAAAQGQGTFHNLDFELANLPPLPSGEYGSLNGVATVDAIPYWTAYYSDLRMGDPSRATYNSFALNSPNISVFGPNWDNSWGVR